MTRPIAASGSCADDHPASRRLSCQRDVPRATDHLPIEICVLCWHVFVYARAYE